MSSYSSVGGGGREAGGADIGVSFPLPLPMSVVGVSSSLSTLRASHFFRMTWNGVGTGCVCVDMLLVGGGGGGGGGGELGLPSGV